MMKQAKQIEDLRVADRFVCRGTMGMPKHGLHPVVVIGYPTFASTT